MLKCICGEVYIYIYIWMYCACVGTGNVGELVNI